MKIFISQKMSGLTEEEVLSNRNKALAYLKYTYPDAKFTVIDNYHHNEAPENAGRLWHLGRSIQQMEEADAIYFYRDRGEEANGVLIERLIAKLYKLKVLD